LLIDEADAFVRGDKEFQSILNSGHTRGMDRVWRVAGKDQGLQGFRTWGAKAIAGIGTFLNETTLDRSIRVELRRKRPDETAEKLLHTVAPTVFDPLRGKLARLAEDTGDTIGKLHPEAPAGLNDRAQDNWGPLLSIADYAGGRWPKAARTAALQLFGRLREALSVSAELLSDIRDIFERTGAEKIRTHDLLAHLNADEEKRWATYCRGRAMTPRPLAELLRGYRIQPHQLGGNVHNPRGYSREQFEDAFVRYLPAETPESTIPPLPQTSPCLKSIPTLTKEGLAKWTPSGPIAFSPSVTKTAAATDKLPFAHRGFSPLPAAGANPSASSKAAGTNGSSGIADEWGDDLDGIEL
jgi:putative DNA primase/helicase